MLRSIAFPTTTRSARADRHYQRHQRERTSLYPIVERHLSILRDELQRHERRA